MNEHYDWSFRWPTSVGYEPYLPQQLYVMIQRRRATAQGLAQGEDEIRRANERMEAELATGTEPQIEDKERSEVEVFESP